MAFQTNSKGLGAPGYRPLEDVAPAPGAAQRLRSSVGVLMDDALLSVSGFFAERCGEGRGEELFAWAGELSVRREGRGAETLTGRPWVVPW